MLVTDLRFSRTPLVVLIATLSGAGTALADTARDGSTLDTLLVTEERPAAGDTPVEAYAGGQVASGSRVGVWGAQDARNVPFSVIGYTEELVRDQQSDTVADILVNDASITTGFGYGNYAEKFTIRGFDLNGEDIAFGGLYGVLPRQVVDLSLAGRVELFKGANAFTHGVSPSGSGVGGSVNLEPKRATAEPLRRVSLGYSSDSYRETAVDLGQRFGEDQAWGVRLNLSHGEGQTAVNDEDRRATAASLGIDYQGQRGAASVDVGYQKQRVDDGRSVVYVGDSLTAIPEAPEDDANYSPSWVYTDLETAFAMVRGELYVNDAWTLYGAVGGNNTHESGEYSSPTVQDLGGDGTASRLGVPYRAKAFASQGGIRGNLITGQVSHQLNLGYSGFYRKTSTAYTLSSPAFTTNLYDPANPDFPATVFSGGDLEDPDVRSRVRADGVALSDTLGFMEDRLLLTLGLRYQDMEVINYTYDGDYENDFTEHQLTPLVGVVFHATDVLSLYANRIEALQPGEVAPFNASNSGQVTGIIESTQYEIGAKLDYGNVGGGVSLFQIEKPVGFANSAGIYDNYGEQRNRGLELSVFGEPLTNLRLIASATLMDPELTRASSAEYKGNDAIGVPEYRMVVSADWETPWVPGLAFNGRVIHNGEQYADEANELRVDDWIRTDIGVRYRQPLGEQELTWRLNVENLAGEEYWASASQGYLTQGGPRTVKGEVELSF